MNFIKSKPFQTTKELLFIAIALIPYAYAVNRIMVPHIIVSGGLTGLCEILYFATNKFIPIWLSNLTINTILLAFAFKIVGWRFCLRTVFGAFTLSMWLKVIPIADDPIMHDPFMACIVSGVVCGFGLAVVFLNNGSSGGTDIVAMMVTKFRHVSMGTILLYCDLIIISSAYFLPDVRSIEKILYGLCFTAVCSMTIDSVMGRLRQSVQFFIFSPKYEEIANAINVRVNRGVTVLHGEGWYSKQPMHVLTVIAKKSESERIFRLVNEIDPNAFVSQSAVIGVFGKGFDPIKK